MPSPEWFFSTLAQSVAAFIGFIIAVGTVTHQIERQRRIQRTNQYTSSLLEFRDKYREVIHPLMGRSTEFYDDGFHDGKKLSNGITGHDPDDITAEFIQEEIEFDNFDFPIGTRFWTHLFNIKMKLLSISDSGVPKEEYVLTLDELRDLKTSTDHLRSSVMIQDESVSKEIADKLVTDPDPLKYIDEPPEDSESATAIYEWNKRHTSNDIRDEPVFAGLSGILEIIRQMDSDADNLLIQAEDTEFNHQSKLKRIIRDSAILSFVGVVIPLISLLTLPESLSNLPATGSSLLIWEILILCCSVGIASKILYDLRELVS